MQDWEVVESTADLIEKRGHCVGSLMGEGGEVCVDGALALVLGLADVKLLQAASADDLDNVAEEIFNACEDIYGNEELERIAARITDALDIKSRDFYDEAIHMLWQWNDAPAYSRSMTDAENKQRVIDGLRKAAKTIRQEDE